MAARAAGDGRKPETPRPRRRAKKPTMVERSSLLNVMDGLVHGLGHFSPPSRAALIYARGPEDEPRVFDPQDLLRGHEPKLQEIFLASTQWRQAAERAVLLADLAEFDIGQADFSGLITYAGRSKPLFFQLWFTEEHVNMCSTGPTRCWLEYAAGLLAHNLSSGQALGMHASGYVLQECGAHAIRDYIVDERNRLLGMDTGLRVFPILDAVLGISRTTEEGSWPRGILVFADPSDVDGLRFITRFPATEQPLLVNHKHVRKLLQAVEGSKRRLISDGERIIGLALGEPPHTSLSAEFLGGHGFLRLGRHLVCSFSDGHFHSSNRRANLVQAEEALLETDLSSEGRHALFQYTSAVVHSAGEGMHGCTVVLDPGRELTLIPGHNLEPPLDLRRRSNLELAKSLARVDGALHIGADGRLHRFACLLDGRTVPGENRARGARYNSALRFTAQHPSLIVVVVSSDRPVSVVQAGLERMAHCPWRPGRGGFPSPPTLSDWLREERGAAL